MTPHMQPFELEFTRLSKARHKRRLQDRWKCKASGHSYCFAETDSHHLQLTEEDLDEWVDMMHDGYATLLAPPEKIVSSILLRLESNTETVRSTATRNSIVYRRPFRLQLNPSLSDIRSWYCSVSATSVSSGNPGPGYFSGKAMKWFGQEILDGIWAVEIRRRMWVMARLIKRFEQEPEETRWKWLLQREKSVNRLVDDLLELSSYDYKRKYREASLAHGSRFNKSLAESHYDDEGTYWLLSSRISPLLFLSEENGSVDRLSASIREILLQETIVANDIDHMISELVVCACNELDYGVFASSRRNAFELIHQLYFVPAGARELEKLGRPGESLDDLAKQTFNGDIQDYKEQWSAVQFFVDFATDHPTFRDYVLAPNGLSLVSRIQVPSRTISLTDWDAISWFCRSIGRISDTPWIIPALLDRDICNILVPILFSHQLSNRPDVRIDYSIIWALRNLVIIGDDHARRAVHDALTAEARDLLRNLAEVTWTIARMGKDVHKWVTDILGGGDGRTEEKRLTARKVTFDLTFRI